MTTGAPSAVLTRSLICALTSVSPATCVRQQKLRTCGKLLLVRLTK